MSKEIANLKNLNWKQFVMLMTTSDIGIAFVVLNAMVLVWYVTLHKQAIPDGVVTVFGVIFGGKTIHGVMKKKEEEPDEEGD